MRALNLLESLAVALQVCGVLPGSASQKELTTRWLMLIVPVCCSVFCLFLERPVLAANAHSSCRASLTLCLTKGKLLAFA